MLRKTDIYKVLTILVIVFFRRSNLLLPGINMETPVAELFLQNIFFGNPSREDTDVALAMFGMLEVIIFNLLFGAHIYRDLYENSIYIFVRVRSRSKWFFRKVVELFLYSGMYHLLFLGSTFWLCANYSEKPVDAVAVRMLIITFVMLQLFTFWSTLCINLVAVCVGTIKSFMLNYIALTVFSAWAIKFEAIPLLNRFPILLQLNPVANVIVNWSSGLGTGLVPAVYFLVIIFLTYKLGVRLISGLDISITNKEYE